jgi:hydrogenase maturation protease
MPCILIIAYGNPLRSDDGIAWQAAEELRRKLPAALAEIICVQQLTPEIADQASRARAVIFLDSSCEGEAGRVRCEPVEFKRDSSRFTHHFTPEGLMVLCEVLYGARPRAFVVSLTGRSFDHGEVLSEAVIDAFPRFVSTVRELADHLAEEFVPAFS